MVGQAQRQRAAKEIDKAEQDFAHTAQADVGVEIPKQAEADDQQRVAMACRRRQFSRGKLPTARACLRQNPRRKFLARLFELGTQSGDLLGPMPGEGLPVIAAFGEIADGDAKFLQRALLVSGTLLPRIPALVKNPDETRGGTLEFWY